MSVILTGRVETTVRSWAHRQGLKPAEAAERLVNTAISRKAALAKYAAKQALKVRRIHAGKKGKPKPKPRPRPGYRKGRKKLAA